VAGPGNLWPPNHKFRLITLTGATDPDGDTVTITITGVTQDEVLDGLGDGDTAPDAKVASASNQVFGRAERSGLGDGRVYRIAFTGSDSNGGTCSGTAFVGVPHDEGPQRPRARRLGPDRQLVRSVAGHVLFQRRARSTGPSCCRAEP